MCNKWLKEKENLERLINEEHKSYEEIGRIYGCTGANIKKAAKRLGLQLKQKRKISTKEHFNKGKTNKEKKYCIWCGKEISKKTSNKNKYCSIECFGAHRHYQKYIKILKGDNDIMKPNYSPKIFREDIINEQGGVCAICGIKPEWNNKKLVFIVDHIDSKASNNKRENLRCICPNCDSQLDTYKSKNKKSDRIYYHYNHR